MYSKSSTVYEAIYRSKKKNYSREVEIIAKYINKYRTVSGNRLLDVACGTGLHLEYLKPQFEVEGLDISKDMLTIARNNHPDTILYKKNMVDFKIDKSYDIITCLFSSIGFVRTKRNLIKAIHCMSKHLVKDGIILLEPWLFPEDINEGSLHAMASSYIDGSCKVLTPTFASRKRRTEQYCLISMSITPKSHCFSVAL